MERQIDTTIEPTQGWIYRTSRPRRKRFRCPDAVMLLGILALLTPSAVAEPFLACKQALLYSDRNKDQFLDRYPEYVTYLDHMSITGYIFGDTQFDNLPQLAQDNYNNFLNGIDNNEICTVNGDMLETKNTGLIEGGCYNKFAIGPTFCKRV